MASHRAAAAHHGAPPGRSSSGYTRDVPVLVARSRTGERRIPADDFFKGLYATALQQDEILLGAEFPPLKKGQRFALRELARRSGDFATVGVAACVQFDGDVVAAARIVLFGVSDRAVTVPATAAVLRGRALDASTLDAAVHAVQGEFEPFADMHHDTATKLHLMGVLLRRVLVELSKGKDHA